MEAEDVRMESGKTVDTLPETYPGGMCASEIISDLKQSFNPDKFSFKGSELTQLLVSFAEQHVEPAGWQALYRKDFKSPATALTSKIASPAVVEVLIT